MTKLLSLISGGIDSPVAACLALEQGNEVLFVHFVNEPFTDSRNKQKVFDLLSFISKKFNKKLKLFLVDHGLALKEFSSFSNEKFLCVFCKRQMLRISSKIAKKENCAALLMGDSLGQVASQTLFNLSAINPASSINVSRPLIGFDKIEIESLAKNLVLMKFQFNLQCVVLLFLNNQVQNQVLKFLKLKKKSLICKN